MINHPLFQIKEKENIVIAPIINVSDSFACDLTVNEIAWLGKKHIFKYLTESTDLTEYLKIYNQSDDCLPEYDMQNSFALFKKLNSKILNLQSQNMDLEQRLKKYTNGENHKRYYEKNKELVKQRVKECREKTGSTGGPLMVRSFGITWGCGEFGTYGYSSR